MQAHIFQKRTIDKCMLEILTCSWKYGPSMCKIRFCSPASNSIQLMSMTIYSVPQNCKFSLNSLQSQVRIQIIKRTSQKNVIHSAYLNVHTHSCLYKSEKCGSRTVTFITKKVKLKEDWDTKLSVTSALKQILHAQIGMKSMTKMQHRSSD